MAHDARPFKQKLCSTLCVESLKETVYEQIIKIRANDNLSAE
jgi:hypothetical protein